VQEVFVKTYLPKFWAVVVDEALPGDGEAMSSGNADAFVQGLEVRNSPPSGSMRDELLGVFMRPPLHPHLPPTPACPVSNP
jgi:hypothetical protein